MLARRLDAIATTAPFFSLALLSSMLLLVFVMDGVAPAPFLYGWAALTVLLLVGSLGAPARFLLRRFFPVADRNDRQGRARSQFALHSMLLQAGSMAWATGLAGFAHFAQADQFATLGVVWMAVFAGVLMIHRYVPKAALFHIVVMTMGGVVGLMVTDGPQTWPLVVFTLIYAVVLVRSIIVYDIGFVAGIANRVAHEESENTIRLLLDEYEVQAKDWLWTIGPNGNLREVSQRLADICNSTPQALEGTRFLDLFNDDARRARLAELLAARKAFSDELVVREQDGQMRYWRVSARPRRDGRMTGAARDVTDSRVIEERVRHMAHHDDLTGLANRYSFNERLAIEMKRRQDGSDAGDAALPPLTLFYCDLDDFKGVNDTYGHGAGDELLRQVARRLEAHLREDDMVARIGGDEFVVLLEMRAGNAMVIERAHRLLAALREPYSIDGHTLNVFGSIGIARSGPDLAAPEDLVHRADLALQDAKRKGRDKIALYAPALEVAMRERRRVEHDLRDAIAHTGLELHYQPIVALDTGATTAYEALLRWNHPTRGQLFPTDFLTVAEDTGLIVPLGEWVIATALREASSWNQKFRLSVNLSPSQLRAPGLLPTLSNALASAAIPATRLEFEVTEHVLLEDAGQALETLEKLREMGVQIALDDFGTGYSSLGYLQRFPFDRVKIDRRFVGELETSPSARAIVSAITRLADALGMETTAEGVEEAGQLELLRKLGCDEAQGFYIRAPLPAHEAAGAGGKRLRTARKGSVGASGRGELRDAGATRQARQKAG